MKPIGVCIEAGDSSPVCQKKKKSPRVGGIVFVLLEGKDEIWEWTRVAQV